MKGDTKDRGKVNVMVMSTHNVNDTILAVFENGTMWVLEPGESKASWRMLPLIPERNY